MNNEFKELLYREVLPYVSHPTRYIGAEKNAVIKGSDITVKFLLAFPEVYEVGMSYLGYKILYGLINESPDAVAERVFSPWPDMEAKLKEKKLPLYSLETFTPAREFDVIGFTLQYEMTFTNVLQILELSNIPFHAKERSGKDPIILGGGPVAYNPEPVADFFDAFLIGEGEEAILEVIAIIKTAKAKGLKRDEIITLLSKIEGVYIPGYYDTIYNTDGTFKEMLVKREGAPVKITKRIVKDFSNAYIPTSPVVPYMNIIQNRVTVEIMRGCTRGCRFCVSGMTTRPVREREVEKIVAGSLSSRASTGFDEISLSSLSSTDHSQIKGMLSTLNNSFSGTDVSIALPSSRIDSFSVDLAASLSSVRKSTLTFAPEAGTQRLRDVINKCVTEKDLLDACLTGVKAGLNNIKLYFMIGLPTETDVDVLGIAALAKNVQNACKQADRGFRGLSVSVSFLVPKPHTPFMWEEQITGQELKRRIDLLRKNINPRWLKWHSLELSALEGVFARGDRKLSAVILEAYKNGARFDGWNETFKQSVWNDAFVNNGIDPEFYTSRRRREEEALPWEHIDALVTRDFLWNELQKAKRGELSPDCRNNTCTACGVDVLCMPADQKAKAVTVEPVKTLPGVKKFALARYNFKYAKTEDIKFVSHLEVMGALLKALERSGLLLARSEGYNPHPKVSFSPALPVGVSSDCEEFEFELTRKTDAKEVYETVSKELPRGLRALAVKQIDFAAAAQYKEAIYDCDLSQTGIKTIPDLPHPATVKNVLLENGKLLLTVDLKAQGPTGPMKILLAVTGLSEDAIKGLAIKRIDLK